LKQLNIFFSTFAIIGINKVLKRAAIIPINTLLKIFKQDKQSEYFSSKNNSQQRYKYQI
jgi:hypothetical protein